MTDRITFAATVKAEGRNIKGAVQLAGQRNRRNGEWLEVDPAAVVKADASKVMGFWEHNDKQILASLANETLTLSRTDQGIEYEFRNLPNTTYANDALELVRGGYVTGSSFSIEGHRSTFSTDPDTGERVRRITHIDRLTDVSPVRDPFFEASSASAFSKENQMPATEAAEEPKAAPAVEPPPKAEPKVEPKATFSQNETAEATERFARTLDTNQIEAAMDGIVAASGGDLKGIALDQYEAYAKVYGERKQVDSEVRERAARMKALHDIRLGRIPKAPAQNDVFASDDYSEAFNKYLRTGRPEGMEQFAQSVAGDGTQGGYTVPDRFRTKITERLKAFGGIAQYAEPFDTDSGEPVRWPSNDDTDNSAAIAAEGAAGTAGADLEFGSVELSAYSYNANGTGNTPLKVSLELIQDSAFDIAGFVGRKLGERIGRKQAADLANGTGSGAPLGLFTKSADTMTATVASLAAPEHVFQVDAAYRDLGNCRFVMSDTTLVKFWQAQASGKPIFIPGGESIGASPHGTLYGFPVSIDPASGNNVAFGDIALGYVIRRVRGVQVLVDPYSASGTRQVAYHAWARMDATIQDSNAYSVSSYSGVSADT